MKVSLRMVSLGKAGESLLLSPDMEGGKEERMGRGCDGQPVKWGQQI
jgi:hypothetical protein